MTIPNPGTNKPKPGTPLLKHGPYAHPDMYLELGPLRSPCDFCGSFRTFYVRDEIIGLKFGCHACDYRWE